MKKLLIILLAMPLLMCSCSNSNEPSDPNDPNGKSTEYTIDKPYDFPEIDKSGTNEDKFAQLQIPESTLKKMTTRALLESGINHPMMLYLTAFNNPLTWVNQMMKSFNGFVEMQKRPNCKIEVEKAYYKTKNDFETLRKELPDYNDWSPEQITDVGFRYMYLHYYALYFGLIECDPNQTYFFGLTHQ